MSAYRVVQAVTLSAKHRPTGRTRHYRDGALIQAPAALKIAKCLDSTGYYLLYLDQTGSELTDTYHESLEAAVDQAEWEFGVSRSDWKQVWDS